MIDITPVDYLKSKGVHYLYHFTELSNLDSIIKYGLLSRDELKRRWQKFHDGAFNHVIEKRASIGISNYVPLNLCSKVPMLFITEGVKKKNENPEIPHIPRPIYFLVDIQVIMDKGTIFTDGHPTESNKYEELTDLDKIDYDVIGQNIINAWGKDEWQELKRKKQAEILIDTKVETHYIKKICFRSIGEWKIAQETLKTYSIDKSTFEVRPDLFSRKRTYLVDYTISNEYDITVELSGYNGYQSEKLEYLYGDGSKKEKNCTTYQQKGTFQYDKAWGEPVSAIYYINDTEIFNIRF